MRERDPVPTELLPDTDKNKEKSEQKNKHRITHTQLELWFTLQDFISYTQKNNILNPYRCGCAGVLA